jgi:putative membrane protein
VNLVIKVVVNAIAIWVAAAVVPGIEVAKGNASLSRTILTLLVVGAIFGIVNALVKPVVAFFSFPFYILTLGLFAFVVNAFMLEIVSWISDKLNISFHIDHFFWSAIGAAVVVTIVSMVLNLVLPDRDD